MDNEECHSVGNFDKFYVGDKFYVEGELGILTFPNGSFRKEGVDYEFTERRHYEISLNVLHDSIYDWKVLGRSVPSMGISNIIAFGEAVAYPGYIEEPFERGKYRMLGLEFGPKITDMKRILIQPTRAEFLVITHEDPMPEKYVAGRTSRAILCRNTYNKNLHLYVRSIGQVIRGAENIKGKTDMETDTISIDALSNGVPIFFDDTLDYILDKTCIKNDNPRILKWYYNDKKFSGTIR
jgi:hypothetical protein